MTLVPQTADRPAPDEGAAFLTSLVIPVYNQLDYTRRCLDSIMQWTDVPFEVIVVDNASTDGTRDYLKTVSVRVISNERNLGCAKAWNQGVKAAAGRVIGILNNDIVVTPGWLKGLLAFMQRGGYGIVSPSAREGLLDYDLDRYAAEFTRCCAEAIRRELYGACMVIDRRVFERIGLFDEAFTYGGCEDVDFLWRAREAGWQAALTGSVLIHHFSMVTQDAIKKKQGSGYPTANLAHFTAKWKRTVRGNWLERRWTGLRSAVTTWYERRRYGYTLIEKPELANVPASEIKPVP
ncbi:MAG: glycosyltransferase family 2 protein [Nitrospiraceae bacterium]